MQKLIDCYPYRRIESTLEYLILQRSGSSSYAGQWRIVTGKVEEQETHYHAALRELEEETGLEVRLLWSVPTVNSFYEPGEDLIMQAVPFAAECGAGATVKLDSEHSRLKWITIDKIEIYIQWPEQARIMKMIHRLLNENQLLDDWIIPLK